MVCFIPQPYSQAFFSLTGAAPFDRSDANARRKQRGQGGH